MKLSKNMEGLTMHIKVEVGLKIPRDTRNDTN